MECYSNLNGITRSIKINNATYKNGCCLVTGLGKCRNITITRPSTARQRSPRYEAEHNHQPNQRHALHHCLLAAKKDVPEHAVVPVQLLDVNVSQPDNDEFTDARTRCT